MRVLYVVQYPQWLTLSIYQQISQNYIVWRHTSRNGILSVCMKGKHAFISVSLVSVNQIMPCVLYNSFNVYMNQYFTAKNRASVHCVECTCTSSCGETGANIHCRHTTKDYVYVLKQHHNLRSLPITERDRQCLPMNTNRFTLASSPHSVVGSVSYNSYTPWISTRREQSTIASTPCNAYVDSWV